MSDQIIVDVPFKIAKKMLATLNHLPGNPFLSSTNDLMDGTLSSSIGYVSVNSSISVRLNTRIQVTNDTCPGVGDDVAHTRLEYYDQPALFSTELNGLNDDDLVDVVFISL